MCVVFENMEKPKGVPDVLAYGWEMCIPGNTFSSGFIEAQIALIRTFCGVVNRTFPKSEEEQNDVVCHHRANSDDDETDRIDYRFNAVTLFARNYSPATTQTLDP